MNWLKIKRYEIENNKTIATTNNYNQFVNLSMSKKKIANSGELCMR